MIAWARARARARTRAYTPESSSLQTALSVTEIERNTALFAVEIKCRTRLVYIYHVNVRDTPEHHYIPFCYRHFSRWDFLKLSFHFITRVKIIVKKAL